LRTRRLLTLLTIALPVVAAWPAAASGAVPWPQFQRDTGRTGFTDQAPDPPYGVSWEAATGLGDPTHVSGLPAPVLEGDRAIVVGREDVAAVDSATGELAWSAPRAIGPSSPPALTADGVLLFLEGGGDESASASSGAPVSSTPSSGSSATSSPSASATPAPVTTTDISTLVALDLETQERLWTVDLSDVSHTGVLLDGPLAIVGADDGTIVAVDAGSGKERWSVDVGDHVSVPMAGADDLVFVSVRPEAREAPTIVALRISDGTEAWRYQPTGSILDLGAPSAADDQVFVVASDSSLRAVGVADGAERWASPLYSPSAGSPPAISAEGVFVTDQSGTVYSFDPATGSEHWRFATNQFAVSGPIAIPGTVLQPTSAGQVVAIDTASGHQIWHAQVSDSVVIGLAASQDLVVVSRTGSTPGLVGLTADPAGATEDVSSPTTADPGGLVVAWAAAAVPIGVVLVLLGGPLYRRMGPPALGVSDDEEPIDPWEVDAGDES
jgi:outer membrane protein assembly factor BamB